MIKLIFNLLIKKGWMIFSNLLISFSIFKILGPEEWVGILIYLSLNLIGLILGSGIKSKTSLSNFYSEVESNYYCMIIINIVSIFFIYIFSLLKNVDHYYIIFFSIVLVVLTNFNAFYQGLMIKDDLIKENTKLLIEANLLKLFVFFLILIFYKNIYVLFVVQIIEQLFLCIRMYKKESYIFNFKNVFNKFKELTYIAVGSAPFLVTLSNFQLDLDKYLSKNTAGYIGFFAQILNSFRGMMVFLVTNLQKKMKKYIQIFPKILLYNLLTLIAFILLMVFIDFSFNIDILMFLLLFLINFIYCLILLLSNIQNILNCNIFSFYSAMLFLLVYLLHYFSKDIFYTPISVVLIYILCMLFRNIMVYFYLRKKIV